MALLERAVVLTLDLDQADLLLRTLRVGQPAQPQTPQDSQLRSLTEYIEARLAYTFGPGFLDQLALPGQGLTSAPQSDTIPES